MKTLGVSLSLCLLLTVGQMAEFNTGGLCLKQHWVCGDLIGSFCMKCDSDGNFLPQHCSGSTGYCWCVNVLTGQEIPGTKTPPGTPPVNCEGPCSKKQQDCNQPIGWVGSFCPQCDSSGNFLPRQCWASTGYCWCVNVFTGQEIPGTGARPWLRPVNCG